jgi:hypothetical protein
MMPSRSAAGDRSTRGLVRLRWWLIAMTAIFVLGVLIAAASSDAHADRGAQACRPGHAYLITANAKAQVFSAPPRGEAPPEVFACVYGDHPSYRLGAEASLGASEQSDLAPEEFARYRLAGIVVAYETFHPYPNAGDPDGAAWFVVVRNLLTGRILHRAPTGPAPPHAHYVGIGETTNIVVKPDGAVAWVACDVSREGELQNRYSEIRAEDRSGRRLLAAGENVEPDSLVLVGSILFWTQDGHTRSAVLH